MGTGNSAVNAAAQANQQQQSSIQAAIGAIQKAYGSPARQQQYQTYGQNLNDYYTGQVNSQEATNARNLQFAEARSGLTGGSAAVDANTQLQKDYTNGLLAASQAAQSGKAALQQSDVNAQNQLVGLAEQGAYTGSVPQATATAQDAALKAAQGYGNANALGNLFAGTSQLVQNEQTAAANRKASITPFGSPYA